MPSYTQYKRQMAVLDADDSEIESWITVRGNHIPIMKGQSKGDAVKAFIEHQAGKNDVPQGTKWTPTNKKGEGTGNKPKQEKPKYDIRHGARVPDIESYINEYADRHTPNSWREEENFIAEKLKQDGLYAYGSDIKKAMKNVYGDVYEQERAEEVRLDKAQKKLSKPSDASKGGSQKKEYDPAFEIDRKNALANYYLYGGKYTQRSKQAAYKEWKNDMSSEENQRAANKWVNSELVAKQSKPSDSSKGGKKETKKYPQDLVDMAHSVMAYGGFGMKPEDILNDSYHGQYLKRYTEKYGKELVLETLKEMASRIDRVDHNVYTGSEGETYNSVIWKAPQLETLPDEEWEATLKKLYKDRGSENKLSKPSDASAAGKPSDSKPRQKRSKPDNMVYQDKKHPNVFYVDEKAWNSPANDPWYGLYN